MNITLVGFAVPGSGTGGIKGMDNYIYQLGKRYFEMRHGVKLLVRGGFQPSESWIKTVYAPGFSWTAYPFFLAPRLLGENADVYHSDYITTGVSLMWARKRPSVVSIHDVIPFSHPEQQEGNNKFKSWWYFRCFNSIRDADALIVMSNSAKQEAIKYAGIEEERLHVVYNGVSHDKIYPLERKTRGKLRIGYLGGLDGRKNASLLVDSFRELLKSHDDIELHVGGSGRNLEIFRKMNIPNAFFHGFVPDDKVNEFYNSLDIFVFPSLAEGFGNMAVESMAAGTPIVVANRTSLPEVVGDAGIVADPDVSSMCRAISRLLDDEKLRKKYSRLGLKRAKQFSWEECAKNTLKVYEKIIK